MALSVDTARPYVLGDLNDLPVLTAVEIFEGSAVGVIVASGFAQPIAALLATNIFGGFALSGADNTDGASGDINVKVKKRGNVVLPIGGTLVITDIGSTVFATADDTFDLTTTAGPPVGKISRFIDTLIAEVEFEATYVESV